MTKIVDYTHAIAHGVMLCAVPGPIPNTLLATHHGYHVRANCCDSRAILPARLDY